MVKYPASLTLLQILVLALQILCGGVHGVVAITDEVLSPCDSAIQAQRFVLTISKGLSSNSVSTTANITFNPQLLRLIANYSAALQAAAKFDTLNSFLDGTPYASWGNFRLQLSLSNSAYVPSALLGEMMYIINSLKEGAAALNATQLADTDTVFGLWHESWWSYADYLLEQAQDMSDDLSQRSMLMRAINYNYVGAYPNPCNPGSIQRMLNASATLQQALALFQTFQTFYFDVPYSQDGKSGTLQAFFVTPNLGVPSPTIIVMSGVYGWVEVNFLGSGLSALRRNYAVLCVQAPGMGVSARIPPHFRLPVNSSEWMESVLLAAKMHPVVGSSMDFTKVVLYSQSSSSYSGAQLCAEMPEAFIGCVMNPGLPDESTTVLSRLNVSLYTAFAAAATAAPQLFPQDLLPLFLDPYSKIIEPLVMECDENSEAPLLMTEAMSMGQILTDPLYLVLSALGICEADPQEQVTHSWSAYQRLASEFRLLDLSGVTTPVLVTKGLEDNQVGGEELVLWDLLPQSTRNKSLFHTFAGPSGASLHVQGGATQVMEEVLYPWIASLLEAA